MLINNRYQVIRPLGEGGFGKTYLVTDTQMPSQRQCVVKQLKPMAEDSAIYQLIQDRFQREAAILEQVGENHRQIPRLYAYFSENQQFYLVQEWIDGEPLDAMPMPMAEADVLAILKSLLPVLSFIHSKGIIHRDIKPENIILHTGPAGSMPVLIDFGAVRETMGTVMAPASQPKSSIVIGTPGYMSAEQAAGRPIPSSDLFSLGLTAIYLLTGKSPQELPINMETGEFEWKAAAPQVSDRTKAVLSQAVRSHPRDRFGNAKAMLNAILPLTGPIADSPAVPDPTVLNANPPLSQMKTRAVAPQGGAGVDTQIPSPNTLPQTVYSGQGPAINQPPQTYGSQSAPGSFTQQTSRRFTPLTIGLMVLLIGGSAIGAGVMVSRSNSPTGDETAVVRDVNADGEEDQSNGRSEDDTASTEDDTAATEKDGAEAPGDNASNTDPSPEPPQPPPDPEPDFPDIPVDNTPGDWVYLDAFDGEQVDIYSYPSYRADTPHYGLGGDRVRELGQPYNSEGDRWQRVLFESGVDGWVPVAYLSATAGTPAPPVDPPPGDFPRAGRLGGTPGERINVRAEPSTSANSPHYGLGGDPVTVLDQSYGPRGSIWYYVAFESGASGWVRGDLVN